MDDTSHVIVKLQSLELARVSGPDELPADGLVFSGLSVTDPWEDLREVNSKFKAAINSTNLVTFVDGLSADEKRDVLESTQFAERAANAKFDRVQEIRDWYGFFVSLLSNMGWVSEGLSFKEAKSDTATFDMSEQVLGIVKSVATGNQVAMLKGALDALAGMAESKEIRWFDFSTTVDVGGNFQIGAAESSGGGIVSMALGAFYYRTNDRRKNALFVKWGRNDIAMWAGAQKLTLDTAFYSQFRDTIRTRLGTASADFIARIPIV